MLGQKFSINELESYPSNEVTTQTLRQAQMLIFTIPVKNYGDPPFIIDPPPSNSPSSIIFISPNENVAIVDGNLIKIVGGGASDVTSFQPVRKWLYRSFVNCNFHGTSHSASVD